MSKVRCSSKRIYAFDTENDWNEEHTEVYFVQCAFIGEHKKEMLLSCNDILEDRVNVIYRMMDIALEKVGCSYFYCANLKHESELLKEGLKIIQQVFPVQYLRRENQMLQISIKVDDRHMIFIRDVLNLYPGTSVKRLGDLFGIEKLDGFKFRPGWSKGIDFTLEENQRYCYRDAEIVYEASKKLHDNKMDGITMSSVAWRKCKEIFNGGNPRNNTMWNRLFPKLEKDLDVLIRKAYIGGINYSKSDFVVKPNTYLSVEDANSMYPTVAVFDSLPYGKPFLYYQKPIHGVYFVVGTWKLETKEGQVDFLHLDMKAELVEGGYEMVLTSVDHELLFECYNVISEDVDYYLGYASKTGILDDWFINWYNYRQKAKDDGDAVMDTYAKYMLNSLTGRFGLRREMTECLLEDDWVTLSKTDDEDNIVDNEDSYLPYVAFITAYARKRLIQHSRLFDPLVHMDTDSCIGYRPIGASTLSTTGMLGGWKVEALPYRIIEGGFKRYVLLMDEEVTGLKSIKMAGAGIPQHSDTNGCPVGMWVEILDNPEVIKEKGYELGQRRYKVKSKWLIDLLVKNGYNPDDIDTRKLMPKKAFGGYIYVPTTMKLHDGLLMRLKLR